MNALSNTDKYIMNCQSILDAQRISQNERHLIPNQEYDPNASL